MLKGTLDDFTLPDIFRLLSQSKKTGRLEVQRSAGQGNVFFRQGDVYFAESTLSRELLGQKLVKAKVITDSQLLKALDDQAESGGRVGEILKTSGIVNDAELEAALRSQVEDAVFDLLRWESGDFDWAPNEETEPEVSLSVSVENLIMEGSRRLDELAIITRKIPSEHAVVAMAPTPPEGAAEINITPVEWRMLVLVNGQRSVLDIANEIGSDVFATMRTLYGLAAAGLVHVPGHVVEDDDEPLPDLPPERPILDVGPEEPDIDEPVAEAGYDGEDATQEAVATEEPVPTDEPVAEAVPDDASGIEPLPDAEVAGSSVVAEAPSETSDLSDDAVATGDSGYHSSAYDPGTTTMEDAAEDLLTPEPVGSDQPEGEQFAATDLPTGDWFDAPQPGDLTAETPEEGASDPFAAEILAPAETEDLAQDAQQAVAAAPTADIDTGTFEDIAADDGGASPSPYGAIEHSTADKRAAVQELSELFRQTEVDNHPTFLIPEDKKSETAEPAEETSEPETKHRVEDDEEITRGLISRLIDGVKGL